jgi:hypothetical protein
MEIIYAVFSGSVIREGFGKIVVILLKPVFPLYQREEYIFPRHWVSYRKPLIFCEKISEKGVDFQKYLVKIRKLKFIIPGELQ